MAATLAEVKQVIEEAFPGADIDGVQEDRYRVIGPIIWEDFRDLDYRERNRLVTERVRDRLGMRGINVGILLPLAPGENP